MKKSAINDALRIARQRKAGGGKTAYLFEDPVGYLAKKGEQVVDTARNLPQTWENYRTHPLVTAFREEPAEMFSSAGKMFGNWVAEKPFAATREAVDLATDLSMYPPMMVAKGVLSPTAANAGEDETARQIQYGIRPAPEEAPQYADGGRTGYGGGGDVIAKAFAALRGGTKIFPKPQRMFPEGARPPGGEYINAATGEAMTGQKPARAVIGVTPEGKPVFLADPEQVDVTGSPGPGSTKTKTNLFKQQAGWKWTDAPEGYEKVPTIVSAENRGQHYYGLSADFPKGVDLERYPNASSEPRLRPTTQGNVYPGEQVGTIDVRGREHPVYDMLTIRNLLAGTGAGAAGSAIMPETEPLEYADGGRTGYADGGYPTMQIDPVTGQPRLVRLHGGGESEQADTPFWGGISSSTSTGPSAAAAPAGSPTASIGVADPNSMSPATAATLAALHQEEAQAPAAANPYGSLAGISQGPPAPAANPYGSLAGITQGPPAPPAQAFAEPAQAPVAPNPYGGLTGMTQGPPAPAPGSTPGVQAPQFSTPSFARADQLEDNPGITGATSVGQSVSNASYGALADQNAQAANLMDAIDAGLGAPPPAAPNASIGVADPNSMSPATAATLAALQQEEATAPADPDNSDPDAGPDAGPEGAPDGGPDAGPEGAPDGGPEGGSEGGEGGSGDGGDGGGGEKRGGLVQIKRRAAGGMVDQALKITNTHNRKLKLHPKKDGSVVKQAVVLASKLAKRQRGRP